MVSNPRRALFVQRGPVGGSYLGRLTEAPDYAPGDAQFLDASRPFDVQIRPLLTSERTPRSTGKYPRGARLIVYRPPLGMELRAIVRLPSLGMELRAIVRLPSQHRANTPENVRRAVNEVKRFDKSIGAAFELALAGTAILATG